MNIKNELVEDNIDGDINAYDYCNTVLIKEEDISEGENWSTSQVDVNNDQNIKIEIDDDIAEMDEEEEDPLNIDITSPPSGSKEKKKYITCTFCRKAFCGKLVKALKCDFCDQTFRWQCRMKLHMQKVHNVINPFNCNVCDRSYGTLGSLRKHKSLSHDSKKTHRCDICNKEFVESYNLKLHLNNVHIGVTPYPCEICNNGKSFTRISGLKRHIRNVHEGVKDYKCELCHKGFAQKTVLKTHVKICPSIKKLPSE